MKTKAASKRQTAAQRLAALERRVAALEQATGAGNSAYPDAAMDGRAPAKKGA